MVERLVVAALATFRVALSIYYARGILAWVHNLAWADQEERDEKGEPTTRVGRLRDWFGAQLECFWCVATWVSIPMAVIAFTPLWWVLVPSAFSCVAVLIYTKYGEKYWGSPKND